MTLRRPPLIAAEIGGDDAAWLRGQELPEGTQLLELDEVDFWGRTYDRAPGSQLYVPADESPTDRAVARAIAAAETPAPPVGVDLFCGAGGFSLGLHEAGFDVVAAVEWDHAAAATYLHNLGHPDCVIHFATDADRKRWEAAKVRKASPTTTRITDEEPWIGRGYRASRTMPGGCRAFFFGDVRALTGRQIMDAAGVVTVDVVFGGPPCQGLSPANATACLEDPRNGLLWQFMRLVAEIRPTSFIIENVPPLLTVAKGALFAALCQLANDAGYDVTATLLNAVWYGVPQYRKRAIVVGTREGERPFQFPMPSHWSLGRRANGERWGIHEDGEEDGAAQLPAAATFDPGTGTWRVPNEATTPGGTTRGKRRPTTAEQLELGAEDAG